MREKGNLWKKRIKAIGYAIVACGGMAMIILDYVKNFMPEELQLILTFITTLTAFMSLLNIELENYFQKTAMKCEKEQIEQVLQVYGVNVNKKQEEKNISKITCNEAVCDMTYLIAQSMHKSEGNMLNGTVGLSSDYYVYTKAAAHVDSYSSIMTTYMRILIEEIQEIVCKRAVDEYPAFFLIVPYGTNIILADAVSKALNIPVLISQLGKVERDAGSKITVEEDTYEYMYKNFLGLDALIQSVQTKLIRENIGGKRIALNGIIIDDNVTSGSTPFAISTLFNDVIFPYIKNVEIGISQRILRRNMLNQECEICFNRIEYSAFIFLAHNNARIQLLDNLKRNKMNLLCFFELSEEAKECIFERKSEINSRSEISSQNMNMIVNDIAPKCKFRKIKSKDATNVKKMIYLLPADEKVLG